MKTIEVYYKNGNRKLFECEFMIDLLDYLMSDVNLAETIYKIVEREDF